MSSSFSCEHQTIGFPEDIKKAHEYYERAYALSKNDGQLVRSLIVSRMIIPSVEASLQYRAQFEAGLIALLNRGNVQ